MRKVFIAALGIFMHAGSFNVVPDSLVVVHRLQSSQASVVAARGLWIP